MNRRNFISTAIAAGAALAFPSFAGAATSTRRLYCAINGSMVIYDVSSWSIIKTVSLPTADGPRGIVCHPTLGQLWIAHGADSGTGGYLLRYDLATDTVVWNQSLGYGCDQPAITADGTRLYFPVGERTTATRTWHILDPLTGAELGTTSQALGPHNTLARGSNVYFGGEQDTYLYRTSGPPVGPLLKGVRPFTIDAAETLAYTTATKKRGFQVSSLTTGTVLKTISFGATPTTFKLNAASHGISLSPDNSEVWVLDLPAQTVRVYTAGANPQHLADVAISPIKGSEQPLGLDKSKTGWVLHAKQGDYVYVGDSGSVISTVTRQQVAFLPALKNTRHGYLEVMFDQAGIPVDTSTHFGMSY